jgi:Na+-translocating ferredoxin:NAD+ oxidoreductase subunit E
MRDELKKSLLLTMPVPLVGIGIIAPLFAGGTIRLNALLGLVALASLMVTNILLAIAGWKVPANARCGIAIVIAGGVLTLAKTSVAAFLPLWNVPVEALAPLLFLSAVAAADTGAYAQKKRLVPVFLDGAGIGLAFTAVLCAAGEGCALAGRGGIFSFFTTGTGVFLVAALIVIGGSQLLLSLKAKKEAE